MGWRLRIGHHTGFQYAGTVVASYNEARLTPLTTNTQTTLDARIEVKPGATLTRYWDYWGTQVTAFDLHEPHDVLEVTGPERGRDLGRAAGRRAWRAGTWSTGSAVQDRFVELLAPTPLTDRRRRAGGAGRRAARSGRAARGRARGRRTSCASTVEYVPGATGVRTSAQEAYDQGTGVCQDIAHLTVGMLRAIGLPARYVSGYLHPDPDGAVGRSREGQSHAWVEWWDGEWTAWDPTNAVPIGPRHVIVARGRDYDDVPPLKGVYRGSPSTVLTVRVEVERLA